MSRIGFMDPLGIGYHAHHLFSDNIGAVGKGNGIIVALAHFSAVKPRQHLCFGEQWLWLREYLAVIKEVKASCDFTGQFKMRKLILANGHISRLVQRISADKARISQKSVVEIFLSLSWLI